MRLPLAVLASFLALPVYAQSQFFEVDKTVSVPGFEMDADNADEYDVFDTTGRKIGEVEEVVGSNRAMANAFVVDFDDALNEYGDEERVIPLTEFEFDGKGFVLADDADVTTMPTWID